MNIDMHNAVFIIDGSSFLYRAYYSLKPLHTSQGEAVQAVYGFCRMLKKLIDRYNPAYVVLVWDSKGKTVRHEMYPDYKSTRQAPPADIFQQKERIIEFADLIGIKQLSRSGIEADDIMYSVASDALKDGMAAVLVTVDKDMAQLLGSGVVMLDPFKDEIIDQDAFEQKKGVPVARLPFFFALIGDASDNIPGVRGIGPKGALELINRFSSLQDLYARIDEVQRPAVKKALIEHEKDAFLSYELFLLRYYAMETTKNDFAYTPKNWAKADSFFEELQFTSLQTGGVGVIKGAGATIENKIAYWQTCNLISVTTTQELTALAQQLVDAGAFAFDTETTGLSPLQVTLVGMSFCVSDKAAYYVPCGAPYLSHERVFAIIQPILENDACKKYMHHAKFDELVLACYGIAVRGLAMDTMIAAHLLLQDWQRPGLKDMSDHFFNESMLTFDEVVKQHKYQDFSQVPLPIATLYAAADARQTTKLAHLLQAKLLQEPEIKQVYETVEHPLIAVLYTMEKRGIIVDKQILDDLNRQITQQLDEIEHKIAAYVPEKNEINLNSPRQVEQLLFYVLQLPPQKKSAKGTGYSTDHEVLTALSKLHPVATMLLSYRELSKLKNTYIEALPTYINPKTGAVHTTFSQTNVATGRLASYEPNLQNIPADVAGYGQQIRSAFKARSGMCFISADYSQIELRVLAHLSKDEVLIDAFLNNVDIHAQTAAKLFDTDLAMVTHQQRQIGKRINFSILYGLTPYGLSKDLDIPFKDAKGYIEKYFAQYPRVSSWMEEIITFAKQHGYVKTAGGRRRYVPGIYEKNKALYEEACRVAVNTVAQGTAAEIVKNGMLHVSDTLAQRKLPAYLLLQIHDELLVEAELGVALQVEALIKDSLESVVSWQIPLVVTTRTGTDWAQVSK